MQYDFYLNILLKIVITVFLLLVYIKISGKSQLAPMSAFDQIGNMVVGAIGGSTLLNRDISIIDSTIFMTIWILIMVLIRYLKASNQFVKELIDGKRVPLMLEGKLLKDNLDKAHISIEDIETIIHKDGITGLNKVKNLWFETNGELTADLYGDTKMSILIIENGVVSQQNLALMKKDEAWLKAQIKIEGIDDLSEIVCAEWSEGKLWFYYI